MGFDKKHYKTIKKFVDSLLSTRPILSNCNCPIEWAETFLPLIVHCEQNEDYEGAKATRDAIIEHANKYQKEKIPSHAILTLPKYTPDKITGIICECGKHGEPL